MRNHAKLVISDIHFTTKFNRKLFETLKILISSSDRVILNGDFWEGLAISFDDFLRSEWSRLFPLLKQKETIYVYGNHDCKILSDNRVSLFCDKAVNEYHLDTQNQNYLFNHGHDFLFPKHPTNKDYKKLKNAGRLITRLDLAKSALIQNVVFRMFGPRILPSIINYIPAKTRNSIGNPGYLLVCGHTHRPYYNQKKSLIDIGFFNYGWANYLVIDDSGDFKLNSQRY